jgi:type II secretion system protein N
MVRAIFSFRTFFYLLYAVVLTAVLLYIRFPTDKFKQYCEKRIEQLLPPESLCRIDRISYHFPMSVIVTNLQITEVVDGTQSHLLVNRLVASPDFSKFLRVFALSGELYKGSFALKLTLDVPARSFQLSDVHLKGFDLQKWANDFGLLERKISGIVGFTGNYQGNYPSPLDGEGKGKLVVTDGSMELLQPVLSISTFEFERIVVEMAHEKGTLGLSGGEVLGKELTADFNGEMKTTTPLVNSNILLSGHLTPKEGFLAAHPAEQYVVEQLLRRYKTPVLPFKVGGSVKRPTFRFSM